ncbi:MAG: ComEC/Rec2 family competence protein [Candidatus Portnoybacteria bacterium]|nr:ComEC/Rec2 family competence protein [Candidatus Portnoybacteria bacterium]
MKNFSQKFIFSWLGVLGLGAILVCLAVFTNAQGGPLEVRFFDVGQGKAVLIKTPEGHDILIDGGPDNSVLQKIGEALPFYDRKIDLLILTHPDSDHLNGLIEVVERYEVAAVIESGISEKSPENEKWELLLKEKNISVNFAKAGQKIKTGKELSFEIFYPNISLAGKTPSNTNSASIVVRLDYGENSFLFTGDAEEAAENYLLGTGANVDVDILDVSHHGSKNSSSLDFLRSVSPEAAIIQVGADNRYGHPHEETLEKLESSGAKIFRTDLCGDINISADSERYKIESECD